MINKVIINKHGVKKIVMVSPNDIFYLKNIKGERWKGVEGYIDVYQISSYGRIKTFHNKNSVKILKVRKNKDGHFTIDLFSSISKKTKRYLVSRLVAKAFIPNIENKKLVVHKNKIKTDNRAINLAWESGSMKGRFGSDNHKSKKILQYDLGGFLIKEWESLTKINKELGFSIQNIRLVCNGKQKKSNNFVWRYKNKIKINKIKI